MSDAPTVIASLIFLVVLCGALLVWAIRNQLELQKTSDHLEESQRELLETRAAFADEFRRRCTYERALGLPVYSLRACKDDLWARAALGDQLAEDILHESMYYEEMMPMDVFQEEGF